MKHIPVEPIEVKQVLFFLFKNMNCLVNDSSLVPDLLHVNQASTHRFLAFQKTETFFILPKMIY